MHVLMSFTVEEDLIDETPPHRINTLSSQEDAIEIMNLAESFGERLNSLVLFYHKAWSRWCHRVCGSCVPPSAGHDRG